MVAPITGAWKLPEFVAKPPENTMKPKSLLIVAVLVGLLGAIPGCSKPSVPADPAKSGRPALAGADASDDDRRPGDRDPCQLLDVKEVEALIGPLAVGPYQSKNGKPARRGDGCDYLAADKHNMHVEVMWEGAGAVLKMMSIPGQIVQAVATDAPTGIAAPPPGAAGGVLHKNDGGTGAGQGQRVHAGIIPKELLPYDIPYAGEWDDIRVIGCCRYLAFLGDASVELNFAGSKATPAQAVDLLDKALLRLDKPLANIDGTKEIEAAKAKIAAFAAHRRPCDYVTKAEAEAIVGKLSSEPSGGIDSCDYHYHTGNDGEGTGSDDVVHVKFGWISGFAAYRDETFMEKASDNILPGAGGMNDQAAKAGEVMGSLRDAMQQSGGGSFESLGKAMQDVARKSEGKKTATPEAAKANDKAAAALFEGPWEAARFSFPEFKAVKSDVTIAVEAGTTPKISRQFAVKIMEKL